MNNVEDSLNSFGKYIVQQSKSNLTRKGHKDTSILYNSINYDLKVSKKNNFELTINMEEYGEYLDKGVKGKLSNKKAPKSPYKFGTGTGRKGGLTESIQGWVQRKRLQWRKPNGQFTTYKETAYTIARSIYLKGLETTNFLTTPFERAFKRLPDEIVEAYALDMDKLFETTKKNARI